MSAVLRLTLWATAALAALVADVVTKAQPHEVVAFHSAHTPAVVIGLAGVLLCLLALWRSTPITVGAGLMFGGLCGNGSEILLHGYATDWLPLAGWLTNVADLAAAAGLLCCIGGYLFDLVRGPVPR